MYIDDSLYHKLKFIVHERIQLIFSDLYLKIMLRYRKSNFLSNFFLYTPIKFSKKNKINILFQNKGVFNEEVIYLFKNTNNVNLLRLNRRILKKLLNFSFNGKNIDHKNWHTEQNKIANVTLYNKLLKRFIGVPNYHMLIIFNWGDGSTGELTEYLKNYKIPTVCLHKEGIMSKVFRDNYLLILNEKRVKFCGKKLLVYNNETKNTFLKSSYNNEDIDVVGSVRFDYIFSLHNEIIDQNKVLIFHPSINAQLPDLFGLNFSFNWESLIKSFYEKLFRLANEFTSTKFIVKIKTRDNENIKKYINKSFKNLIIDNSTSSISLLKNSKLCIGFNTTGLIEASAFNIPTINYISENYLKEYRDYVIDYKSLVINTDDYNIIKKFIINKTSRSNPNKVKLDDLKEIVGNNDGKVKDIINESILKLISND